MNVASLLHNEANQQFLGHVAPLILGSRIGLITTNTYWVYQIVIPCSAVLSLLWLLQQKGSGEVIAQLYPKPFIQFLPINLCAVWPGSFQCSPDPQLRCFNYGLDLKKRNYFGHLVVLLPLIIIWPKEECGV